MINRRRAIRLALATLPVALMPSAVRAQQAVQRFFPLLVDLQGWTGRKPDGVAMETPGNSMVTASREYERSGARLSAQLLFGPAAQGALAATRTGVKIETGDARMGTSTVDGVPVTRTFTISNKSGAILVPLGTSGVFTVSFNGIDDEEALSLARKFN